MDRRRVILAGLQFPYHRRTLALGYLKAYADSVPGLAGKLDVRILDFTLQQSASEIARAILAERPALAGFSCYLWNIQRILEVSSELKRARPGLPVVVGGPEVTPRAEELLKASPEVDFVVLGEGELTFGELLAAWLEGGRDYGAIAGLVFRGEGGVVRNPDRPLMPDLDVLPSPYLTGAVRLEGREDAVSLETSRGCPFDCKFCDWQTKQRIRYFSVDRVLSELDVITKHASNIEMCDSDVLMNSPRARQIYAGFLRLGRSATLSGSTYLPYADPAWIRELDSPQVRFYAGIQTVNEEALEKITRRFDREKMERSIGAIHERAGSVFLRFQLIYGLPFDDLAGHRRSIDWCLSMHPGDIDLFKPHVLPGAGFGKDPDRFGLTFVKEPPYTLIETTTFPKKDIFAAERLAFVFDFLKYVPGVYAALAYLGEIEKRGGSLPFLSLYEKFAERLSAAQPRFAGLVRDFHKLEGWVPMRERHGMLNCRVGPEELEAYISELASFCRERLEREGRLAFWPALEHLLRVKLNSAGLRRRLASPEALGRLPFLDRLRGSGRTLWLGWEGASYALGGDRGPFDRASAAHVVSHGHLYFLGCPEAAHVHLRELEGPSLPRVLAPLFGEERVWDAVVVADVYSRMSREARLDLLASARRRAAAGTALVVWDDLLGPSALERGAADLIRAASAPSSPFASPSLTPDAVRAELAQAGWTLQQQESFSPSEGAAPAPVHLFAAGTGPLRRRTRARGAARSGRPTAA